MAQFARPDSDVSVGLWTDTPLWSKVDDDTSDSGSDTDSVQSDDNTSPDNAQLGLSTVNDPGVGTGHVLKARLAKSATGGHNIEYNLSLIEGGSNFIAQFEGNAITTTTLTEVTHALSEAEANSIGDYSDLSVIVGRTGDTGGDVADHRSLICSAVELEVPEVQGLPTDGVDLGEDFTVVTDEAFDADGIVLGDTASESNKTGSLSDGASLGENFTVVTDEAFDAEGVSLGDSASTEDVVQDSLSDGASLGEDFDTVQTFPFDADTVLLGDSASTEESSGGLSDGVQVGDVISALQMLRQAVADGTLLGDSPAVFLAQSQLIEQLVAGDEVAVRGDLGVSLTEGLLLSDTPGTMHRDSASEGVLLSDLGGATAYHDIRAFVLVKKIT